MGGCGRGGIDGGIPESEVTVSDVSSASGGLCSISLKAGGGCNRLGGGGITNFTGEDSRDSRD